MSGFIALVAISRWNFIVECECYRRLSEPDAIDSGETHGPILSALHAKIDRVERMGARLGIRVPESGAKSRRTLVHVGVWRHSRDACRSIWLDSLL